MSKAEISMNKTHFEHTAYALVLLAIGYFTGFTELALGLAIGLMSGREHAQAEYKYLQTTGLKRSEVKWLELRVLVTKSAWSKDSVLDFVIPTVAATSTYLLLTLL